MLQIVDKYFNGNLTFHDLWRSYLEHRTLAYHLIFLGNAILFQLNTLIDIHMSAVIVLITAILVFFQYKKSMIGLANERFVQISFITISIIIFSLNQWEIITLGIGVVLFLRVMIFIMSFSVLNDILLKNKLERNNVIKLTILIISSVLLFGAGYFPACIGSMVVVLLIKILSMGGSSKGFLSLIRYTKVYNKTLMLISSTAAVGIYLYLYNISNDNMGTYTPIVQKLIYIIYNPVESVKFFLLSNTASILGVEFAQSYLNEGIMLFIGGFVILLYILSVIIFIRLKMYKNTYLPILFILHSLLICSIILVGRLSYGITYGMSSRYVVETQLGIIGVAWIFIYYYKVKIKSFDLKNFKSVLTALIICFILGGQVISNIHEWRTSPYRKIAFEKMRSIAANSENYSNDDLMIFQYEPQQVRVGIEIMKKYKLNVFSDYKTDE